MVDDKTLRLTSRPPETETLAGERLLDFEVFFDREKARLFRALCLVTRNRFEAEELTQDAFLSVYERWDRVGTMDNPSGYLSLPLNLSQHADEHRPQCPALGVDQG
jgi:DNA-directed RNA polymerase specialized sigma24 family protein